MTRSGPAGRFRDRQPKNAKTTPCTVAGDAGPWFRILRTPFDASGKSVVFRHHCPSLPRRMANSQLSRAKGLVCDVLLWFKADLTTGPNGGHRQISLRRSANSGSFAAPRRQRPAAGDLFSHSLTDIRRFYSWLSVCRKNTRTFSMESRVAASLYSI
jgi:hypothetical protein